MQRILETGDILHCKGNSLLSKLILKFTNGKFSHTAIAVEIWGQIYIVGAQKNGINPRLFSEWQKQFNYTFEVSRPKQVNKKEISRRIFSKVGVTKYDYKSLLFLQPWYLITGKWKGKRHKAEDRFYCSEFVGWVYDLKKWRELSPQKLFESVFNDPNYITLII